MYNKKKILSLGIIICIGVIVFITLSNFPKILGNKDEESKEQISAQVTVLEENDKTEQNNQENTETNQGDDNTTSENNTNTSADKLNVSCTLVQFSEGDSDEMLESFSTFYSINNSIDSIKKEHIPAIDNEIKNGLASKSPTINNNVQSYTLENVKEIKVKNNTIFIATGKINNMPYMTLYISEISKGQEIIDNFSEKLGIFGNILGAVSNIAGNTPILEDITGKFTNWHGSVCMSYMQTNGKSDMIDVLVSILSLAELSK